MLMVRSGAEGASAIGASVLEVHSVVLEVLKVRSRAEGATATGARVVLKVRA